jgi:putative radical SAM enzyme (TIGR03279 family)
VEQRLSPLYISVHSTDPEIRKFMLGLKKDDRLIEKIDFLAEHKIELHAQIVLCPLINDGESLVKTIHDLAQFYPQLKSIAMVPVGLTKHRQQLYPLQSVTPQFARDLIFQVEKLAQKFKQTWGDYFIYLADEFYLSAGMEFPSAERYDEFNQIENGVGMARNFIDQFEEQKQYLPHRIKHSQTVTLVSGILAAPIIERWVIPPLNRIENLTAKVVAIVNSFYGDSVTVTGLLTGQDIYNQLSRITVGDRVVLPANCLNYDRIFLDDWTPEQLQDQLKTPLEIVDNDFLSFIEKLK